uniref:DUF834 domain-containing protein n=1 Tax=Oryza glumipatula TaxID=40148 RepID=A0A0D9ZZR0_9ORYZ
MVLLDETREIRWVAGDGGAPRTGTRVAPADGCERRTASIGSINHELVGGLKQLAMRLEVEEEVDQVGDEHDDAAGTRQVESGVAGDDGVLAGGDGVPEHERQRAAEDAEHEESGGAGGWTRRRRWRMDGAQVAADGRTTRRTEWHRMKKIRVPMVYSKNNAN